MKTVVAYLTIRAEVLVDDTADNDKILDMLNELDYSITSDDYLVNATNLSDYSYRIRKE